MNVSNSKLAYIELCSYVDSGITSTLKSALTAIGYKIDSSVDSPHVRVIILGRETKESEQQIDALFRDNTSKTLGVYTSDTESWSECFINQCDDCMRWPCAQVELQYRLNRLSGIDLHDEQPDAEQIPEFRLIGESTVFKNTRKLIARMADCNVAVLILGETGTGKEMAARAIHYQSARASHPFAPVNCGAIPDSLIESELYGHVRGAFTDAKTESKGLVGQAASGTLFLDEIDALSPKAQVVLLRFLDGNKYRLVGGKEDLHADVRIVAASNANLEELVEQGAFRRDLFFRLNTLRIELPPLRERGDDITMLARHFFEKAKLQHNSLATRFSARAMDWMRAHDWPGNVRELENAVIRGVLLADGKTVNFDDQTETKAVPERTANCGEFRDEKARAIATFEKSYLRTILAQAHGNVSCAARIAGTERRTLGRLLKKHGIDKQRYISL